MHFDFETLLASNVCLRKVENSTEVAEMSTANPGFSANACNPYRWATKGRDRERRAVTYRREEDSTRVGDELESRDELTQAASQKSKIARKELPQETLTST